MRKSLGVTQFVPIQSSAKTVMVWIGTTVGVDYALFLRCVGAEGTARERNFAWPHPAPKSSPIAREVSLGESAYEARVLGLIAVARSAGPQPLSRSSRKPVMRPSRPIVCETRLG